MYLLKLEANFISSAISSFTFHYVSIKTKMLCVALARFCGFTFHYVSIKTCRCRQY